MVIGRRFVFVHIPKTGGTTITASLGGKTKVCPKGKPIPIHMPLSHFDKGYRIAFAFVRNPWARLVSYYRFMCQKSLAGPENWDQDHVRSLGFKRWLIDPAERFWMVQDKLWLPEYPGLAPMQQRPQAFWLAGVELVGRFEKLAEDFGHICDALDISAPSLGHMNSTEGAKWWKEYDQETADFVAEHNREDIDRFNYRF